MGDKPRFSPNDTYVLDDTVIKNTEKLRITGILREFDKQVLGESAGESDSSDEQPPKRKYNPRRG